MDWLGDGLELERVSVGVRLETKQLELEYLVGMAGTLY